MMWWVIGIIGFLLLLVVGKLTGWLLRGVELVLSALLEGVGSTLGCLIGILIALVCLSVLLQLLIGL